MCKHLLYIKAAVTCVMLLAFSPRAQAQWLPNGRQVFPSFCGRRAAISDGEHGAFIFGTNGGESNYLTRLDPMGERNTGWPAQGALESGETWGACRNGDGGVSFCAIDTSVRLARYTATGQLKPGWPRHDVATNDDLLWQVMPFPNGRNVAIILTTSFGSLPSGLRVKSYESDGSTTPDWPDSGRVLFGADATRDTAIEIGEAVSSPDGGCWIPFDRYNWHDQQPNPRPMFAIHLGADGLVDSSFGGGQLLLAAAPALGSDMHLTSDGADGFYCAWTDWRTGKGVPPERFLGYLDIYVTHFLGNGHLAPGWPASGLPVCTAWDDQYYPEVAPDGTGGVFVLWSPNGGQGDGLHVQRILANAELAPGWPVDGKRVFSIGCDVPKAIVSDGLGGVFVSAQGVDPVGFVSAIYAQHVNGAGDYDAAWSSAGYMVDQSDPMYARTDDVLVPSEPGSAIIAWARRTSNSIYVFAQKLVVGGVVEAQTSLSTFDATPERVRLDWLVSGDRTGVATVERQLAGGTWATLATVTADGTQHVRYEDRHVVPGTTYDYRLSWAQGTGRDYSAPSLIHVPLRAQFALAGARPNPASSRDCRITYSLAEAGPAQLELFDVNGRRVTALEVGANGIGEHVARLAHLEGAGAGIYWARLHQGTRTATARVVLVE